MMNYSIEINVEGESISYSREDAKYSEPTANTLIKVFVHLLEAMGYNRELIIEEMKEYISGK